MNEKARGGGTWVVGRDLSKWRLKIKRERYTGESIRKRGKTQYKRKSRVDKRVIKC